MPELPEVENVVRSLRPHLVGCIIASISAARNPAGIPARPDTRSTTRSATRSTGAALTRILRTPLRRLRNQLTGARIESVERYGKNILLACRHPDRREATFSLRVHLGMTGRLIWESAAEPRSPHTHLVIELQDGALNDGGFLHYTDIRQFGEIELIHLSGESAGDKLFFNGRLGPDPLEITFVEFARLLRPRRARIKSLLLDQHFLRGLGNIYVDESLFRARIHPASIAAQLGRPRAERLYRHIRQTLEEAIAAGGSSISDYVDGQGRPGSFQQSHQVYQRTGEPCPRCGARIRRILIASRGTHFCPRCQRAPRRLRSGQSWRPALSSSPLPKAVHL